jgi:glycosyltransferase involved in cell wall biosynthesis
MTPGDLNARVRAASRSAHPDLVSVVIPAFNAAETIADQLRALEQQTYPGDWETIVADNGSADETRNIVGSWTSRLPHVRLVDARNGRGAAHARNAGAAAARGELLAFCDADDVVDPRWLDRLVAAATTADAVGGRIEIDLLNDPVVAEWRRDQIPDRNLMTTLGFLPFAWTSNLAVWRDVFTEVGGVPTYDGAAGEDVAFSWNLQLRGGRLDYASDAIVHYRLRADPPGLLRQFHRYGIAQARLYHDFRSAGAQRRPLPGAVKAWAELLLELPRTAWDRRARVRWLRQLAYEVGCVHGAVRHRVVFAG